MGARALFLLFVQGGRLKEDEFLKFASGEFIGDGDYLNFTFNAKSVWYIK